MSEDAKKQFRDLLGRWLSGSIDAAKYEQSQGNSGHLTNPIIYTPDARDKADQDRRPHYIVDPNTHKVEYSDGKSNPIRDLFSKFPSLESLENYGGVLIAAGALLALYGIVSE